SLLVRPPSAAALYTLSLHDALPISRVRDQQDHAVAVLDQPLDLHVGAGEVLPPLRREADEVLAAVVDGVAGPCVERDRYDVVGQDRKSTRLNSIHQIISYAVFCLKK